MIVAAAAGTFSRATKFPEESFRITGENGSSNTTTAGRFRAGGESVLG